ncbi:hypothetical protein HPC49_06235 [Pyxidicoccus fallax]|uniref:Lipoprotein MlpA n=1 Tax=Pyxidicoccus fallax TaxID=394095 RepID=A0A848LGW7_9BACT|nr:hypothetical protein [Pyxidicoccus fallax]NMO16755.1 hypothetical protein [Pyxidicoccus fallax]NPC77852.1 hypothetical protein [Pyxidicoccus fallax]
MKLRLMGLSLGVAAAAVAVGACGTEEPEPQCVVARARVNNGVGSFATTYTLLPGQNPDRACAQLTPEPVGLQKFFGETPDAPDSVAVRSERMGRLVSSFASRPDPDTSHRTYSVGSFASEAPGPDNFCDVPQLSPARLDVPAAPAGLPDGGTLEDGGPPALPAQSYAYEWSKLRIYNTPGIPGTQFTADLRYTENGCTADYNVKGIWPVVRCGTADGGVNEAACDPYADYDAGRLRGSGINPLFPVKCDPVALICVLTGEVPSDQQQP